MRLTAIIHLQPTPEQAELLKQTLARANAACNYASGVAWEQQVFRKFDLHHLTYYSIREKFGLTAQLAVRVISKVADSYKTAKKDRHEFKLYGAVAFDSRILSYNTTVEQVSIWTIDGRQKIPFVCGDRQRELLQHQQGESDLCLINGEFYLFAGCEVEGPTPLDVEGVLGVDLGVTNIAVDSDGEVHSASKVNNVRARRRRLRSKLQAKGTRSAKRKLKKLSGKERRFAKDVNHCISKRLVAKAKDTNRAIALEDLTGIRERVTVRRAQRATHHSWSFHQLRSMIEYKAKMQGVPVSLVDPRNTSRTCPSCGHVAKENRKSQSKFSCVVCGFAGFADHIAAVNISRRAAINLPNVSGSNPHVQTQRL